MPSVLGSRLGTTTSGCCSGAGSPAAATAKRAKAMWKRLNDPHNLTARDLKYAVLICALLLLAVLLIAVDR